jgi:hypothetical protein
MAITQQASKLRPNEAYNSGSTGIRTTYLKAEFKEAFNKVQHLVGSKQASGTPGTYKVQFAVTDTLAIDTVANAYLPVRGGVTYNDKSAFGWKDATFGGAASKQIGLAPSQNNNSVIHMSTDVMDLASIPRADGKPGGILLVKITQTDAAGQFYVANGSSNPWDQARGKFPWFSEWYTKSINADAIADLTKLPSGAPYNEGYEFPGFPVVMNTASTVPVELVMFTGDSRKCAAFMTYNYASPARMAAMGLTTPERPFSTVNASGSGHNQVQYLAVAMDMLNAGVRPTLIHIPGFSQNGFANFATFKANNDNFMAAARAIPGLENVKFVIDTDYWVNGYAVGTSAENGRRECVAYAKSLHNGTTVFCFDSDAIITDYSNASATTFKPAYFSGSSFTGGDIVHAGPIALDAMAYGDGVTPGLQSVYRTALGMDTPVADTTAPVMNGSITVSNVTASGFALGCDAASDAVGVAGYEYSIDGGVNYIAISNAARTVIVSGRPAATAHAVRMRAYDAAGNRATSLAATATTTTAADTTAPVMTGEITVSAITTSGATLSCSAATDAVGVAGYEYSINGGTNYTVIANAARSVVVSGRPASTAHAVRMRAFDAAGNRATPLSASFTTLAEQPAQNAVVASAIAESRRVAFPGGTRVVAFGSVPGARTPNAPYLEAGKWWSEKHPLDERYWVANLTIDLAERGTTAVSVEAIVAGVTVLQQPVIQGKLIPVKLGGFNAATGAVNFCTFRVTCANSERFDRTIWFKQQVGSWSLEKDADDESYFVADISNDLADSNTTASAVLAQPVGVSVLVPAVIQGALILVKLGGMDTLPAGVNYCDLRIDCANSERFYRTIQFNRVDN